MTGVRSGRGFPSYLTRMQSAQARSAVNLPPASKPTPKVPHLPYISLVHEVPNLPKELESMISGTEAHGRIFHVKTSTIILFMALLERLLFHKHLDLLDHFFKKCLPTH